VPVSFKEATSTSPSSSDNPSFLANCGLGIDILGPFPRAVRGFEYLYVAIDKFIKWPKVEPVRKVTAQSAIKFFRA
jgi:hypothetical protein